MVLRTHVGFWVTELDYLGKSALDKNDQIWPKITQKFGWSSFSVELCIKIWLQIVLDKSTNGVVILCKNCYMGKFLFTSYMSASNQFAGFSHHHYLWRNQSIYHNFSMERVTKEKWHLRLPLLVWCDQGRPATPKLV